MRRNRTTVSYVPPQPQAQPTPEPETLGDVPEAPTVPQVRQPTPGQTATSAEGQVQPTIEPELMEVRPELETVEARLNRLTASDSPYIRQAQEDAMRSANTRGLINSSIAAAAGTRAGIREALPIAQADAELYARERELNQNTINEFRKQEQSANLNKELAAFQNTLDMEKAGYASQLGMQEEAYSSQLAMTQEKFNTELKTRADLILNDAKFSDEMKLQYVSTINNIMRDSQQQIVDIGMSDRSAAQQATAIELVNKQRNAQIKVYEDLLNTFDDWNWGTDFTPATTTVAQANNNWNAPGGVQLAQEPRVGAVIDNQRYQGGGIWAPIQQQPATSGGGARNYNTMNDWRWE